MNILFIATVYNHLSAFHKPFMKYFQDQGFNVHAAGADFMGRKVELEEMGVICHDISFDKSVLSRNNRVALNELKNLFESNHFDLIHLHTPIAAFLVRFVLRRNKSQGPVVYTAHGFHFYMGAPKRNWLIYFSAEKLAMKWTNHLITINDEDFKNSKKLLGFKNVSLVHGVGVEDITDRWTDTEKQVFKQDLGLQVDSLVVSYVAEINSNKNQKFLLENWKEIKQLNPKLELLIIGTGKSETSLKHYVSNNQLVGVHFLGYRMDVPQILSISDINVLLSDREGLPKSIMEAMVMGLPCIVTNTRGLRDLVINNENGFVVNKRDKEKLIESFRLLGQSEELRKAMGHKGKMAIKPYLMVNVIKEYNQIYTNLLQNQKD